MQVRPLSRAPYHAREGVMVAYRTVNALDEVQILSLVPKIVLDNANESL